MTTLRPKDLIDQLSISASTLRLWSEKFGPVLSPGARKSTAESGGAAQRRFVQEDLDVLRRAKIHLGEGKTYEETLSLLQTKDPREVTTAPETPAPATTKMATLALDDHPVLIAFREALKAKDETIAAKDQMIESLQVSLVDKDQALESLQAAKDETIAGLKQQLDQVVSQRVAPSPEPVAPPRFKWGFLNRLLTGGQDSLQ